MRTSLNRGQMSLMTALIGALGIITASAFTSWTTANNRVSSIDAKVQVVEERENNHYLEVSKKLDSIDKKLDEALRVKK